MSETAASDRWFTDHPPSERFPHYTRANAGEVLPTPASPLGQTHAFDKAILPGFELGSTRLGVYEAADYRGFAPEMCGFFGGYFFINLSCVRMQAVRNPAITVEQLDVAIFGDQPDTPAYTPHADDEKPHLAPIAEAHMGFVLSATEWPELEANRERSIQIRADRPDFGTASDADLLSRVRELHPVLLQLSSVQMMSAGSSSIAPAMLAAVGDAIGDPTIPMRLLAGMGDVDSAAPSFVVWDLSRQVRASTELTAAFDAGMDNVLSVIEASDSPDVQAFASAFEAFVYEFGARGPNEWELSAETWETSPTIALAAINQVRQQDDSKSPVLGGARLAAERDALIETTRAQVQELGEELTGVFEGALIGGNMMVFRERTKTTLVRVLHESRMALRELGRRHAEAGNLDKASHIFMLTDDELDDFVAEPTGHRERLATRADEWAELWKLQPPFFIRDGQVPPLGEWPQIAESDIAKAHEGDVLTGVSGSPGVVEGRARIVLDPADPPDLVPGDIMIAPLTDPAWTPLFLAAEGVVVNVGGQISHAVIVSRELGLPCVISVDDATNRIPEGATISVDGARGEVTIISVP